MARGAQIGRLAQAARRMGRQRIGVRKRPSADFDPFFDLSAETREANLHVAIVDTRF